MSHSALLVLGLGGVGLLVRAVDRLRSKPAVQPIPKTGKAESAPRDPERELLDEVLDALPIGVWITDRNGTALRDNAAARAITQAIEGSRNADGDIARNRRERPCCQPFAWQPAELFATGQPMSGELLNLRTRDGTMRTLVGSALPLRHRLLRREATIIFAEDVTERQRASEELRLSKELFQTTFDSAAIGIFLCDPVGRFLMVNRALVRMTGYEEQELLKICLPDVLYPQDMDAGLKAATELRQGEAGSRELEIRCLRKDGRAVWAFVSLALLRGKDGQALYLVGQAMDITARKQAEQKLRASEASLANAQRIANLGDWKWSVPAGEIEWSAETARILGLRDSACCGFEDFAARLHPDDVEAVRSGIRQALAGERPFNMDYRIVRPDGAIRSVHSQGEVMRGADLSPVRMVGVVQDITERKRIERQLIESREQMRELAAHLDAVREEERKRIAREIHDELGQMLTALKMEIALLQRSASDEAVAGKVRDMRELVEQTIRMVRQVASNLRPAALNVGIVPALEWLAEDFSRRTEIPVELALPEAEIELDDELATAVFRITQECLTNVTRHAEATEVGVTLAVGEERIELHIRDDGKGFDAVAATRGPSFGLLGIRERVLLQGGDLSIDTAPGCGCELAIRLPITLQETK